MVLFASGKNRTGGWLQSIDVEGKYLLLEENDSTPAKCLIEPDRKLSLRLRRSLEHSLKIEDG